MILEILEVDAAMNPLTCNSLRMMERSMEFLWAKQAAHLDNISNAETPGYKVKTVTFEEAFDAKLRAAAAGNGSKTRRAVREVIEADNWSVTEDEEVTRMDGNGVNVTEQSMEAVRTAYQIQYVYQTISSDLTILGKAINA